MRHLASSSSLSSSSLWCCCLVALLVRPESCGALNLPRWTYEAPSHPPSGSGEAHFSFGFAMGRHLAPLIARRYNLSADLTHALEFTATPAGTEAYAQFLALHEQQYPLYMEEVRGIAAGSGQPFSTVFVMNMIQEMLYAAGKAGFGSFPGTDHCSDYVVCAPATCFTAHNEDGGVEDANTSALVTVSGLSNGLGPANFTGFVYAGDLVTGGFGFNANKVAFTLNKLHPQPEETAVPGLGRVFVSRDMLEADSVADCLRRGTVAGQTGAHNLQIMSMARDGDGGPLHFRGVLNVEAASRGRYSVRPVAARSAVAQQDDPPLFHANSFLQLVIDQEVNWSSDSRVRRAAQLPVPTTTAEALAVLGDQFNRTYPIFHDWRTEPTDLSDGVTLVTVLFDLDASHCIVYAGNPKLLQEQYRVAI